MSSYKFTKSQVELFVFFIKEMVFRPDPYKRIYDTIFPTLRSSRKEFYLDSISEK